MSWIESLISAADNTAGALISGGWNAINQSKTNAANLEAVNRTNQMQYELAKYQASEAERMWRLDNEYNSPAAQMERLKAAGLNPHLVYGNGSVANTSQSPPQGFQAPDLETPKYQAYTGFNLESLGMKGYLTAAIQSQQLDNLKEQNELIKSQADAQAAAARHQQLENIILSERSNFARQLATYEVDGLEQSLRNQELKNQQDYFTAQEYQYNYQHLMPLKEREARLRIKGLQLSNAYTRQQRDQAAANTARIIYEIENSLPTQIRLSNKQQELLDEQVFAAAIENKYRSMDESFFTSIGLSPRQAKFAVSMLNKLFK